MLIVQAPCKLNLTLDVVRRRGDGWHDIDSLLVPVDWHDLVGLTVLASPPQGASLTVTGPLAFGVPADDDNLALRAVRRLAALAPKPLSIRVWLHKAVPAAAGLGGGSADAAAALRGAAALLGLDTARDRGALLELAMSLGSDVPALLAGGPQRVRGRGDELEPVTLMPLHLAVAVAGESSTPAVYAALDTQELGGDRVSRAVAALRSGAIDDQLLGSALEPAALRTSAALAAAVTRLRALTPERRWHLTGSGGALFCVASDRNDARAAAACARAHGFLARACRSLTA